MRIIDTSIFSEELKREVKLTIMLPLSGYDEVKVLYCHDGQNLFFEEASSFGHTWKMAETIQRIEEESNCTYCVVGIHSNQDMEGFERLSEYSIWTHDENIKLYDEQKYTSHFGGSLIPPKGSQYIDFIANTLIEHVESKYDVKVTKKDRYMLGSSMGGLITHTMSLMKPSLFSKVYCISNAYWYNKSQILKLINDSETNDIKYYIDVGGREDSLRMDDMNNIYLETNNDIIFKMNKKGYDFKYEVFSHAEHNEISWANRLYSILKN